MDDDEERREPPTSTPLDPEAPEDAIPTRDSLALTSDQSTLKRDAWMLSQPPTADGQDQDQNQNHDPSAHEDSFFSSLGGKGREKRPRPEKPDPEKLQISSRELNTQLREGKSIDEYTSEPQTKPQYGAPGHQWRMIKLRRVYETAEEERRPVEEVALERYATMQDFNEARAERLFLDQNQNANASASAKARDAVPLPGSGSGRNTPMQNLTRRSFMLSDSPGPSGGLDGISRPNSRQSFRRPGESSLPSTPQATGTSQAVRQSTFRQSGYDTPGGRSDASTKPSTPIPSVFTPVIQKPARAAAQADQGSRESAALLTKETAGQNAVRPLSSNQLNKLQAKVMRAELMGAPNAQALKDEFERESARAKSGGDQGHGFFNLDASGQGVRPLQEANGDGTEIQVLPTLDGRGRLYDVGSSAPGDDDPSTSKPGNRSKKDKFETRDSKTGELLRYNKDDDSVTLAELVRQERFGAGSRDQKDMDAELATHIMRDTKYDNDEDYIDDNVERLARKRVKTDAMKRQFAIQDFARTKKALDSCIYCWQDEGARPPRAKVVSSGTRVYLALPEYESLTEGHCLIVPMQHHLSSLEAEDDTWDEIRNFMKCLIQMAAAKGESMVFYETVLSLKAQKHTFIEAVPVPADVQQILPGVFKESLMMVEEEWSQNAKVIDFAKKAGAGGFRRSMVPQLPYFMVQWDHRGERGYGHVIEKSDGALVDHGHADSFDVDEGGRSGGDFPR